MKFSEILKLTAQHAQQIVLFHIVEEIVNFLENDQYRFTDLLNALSEYTEKAGTIDKENANWELASKLIRAAAVSSETSEDEKSQRSKNSIAEYYRQAVILQMVRIWLEELQTVKCRISSLLLALAEYAESEAKREPDKNFWILIAAELRAGAEVAEQEGAELF